MMAQSFTPNVPLLTATSTLGLGRRCWSSAQWSNLHILIWCSTTEPLGITGTGQMPFLALNHVKALKGRVNVAQV